MKTTRTVYEDNSNRLCEENSNRLWGQLKPSMKTTRTVYIKKIRTVYEANSNRLWRQLEPSMKTTRSVHEDNSNRLYKDNSYRRIINEILSIKINIHMYKNIRTVVLDKSYRTMIKNICRKSVISNPNMSELVIIV